MTLRELMDVKTILFPIRWTGFFITVSDEQSGAIIKALCWYLLGDENAGDCLKENERLFSFYDGIRDEATKNALAYQLKHKQIAGEDIPERYQRWYNEKYNRRKKETEPATPSQDAAAPDPTQENPEPTATAAEPIPQEAEATPQAPEQDATE